MKNRALIISPKVPEYPENRRDRRLYSLVRFLAGKYDAHFMYIQSMFTKEDAVKKIEALGVKVFSFQEVRSQKTVKLEKQMEVFLKEGEYRVIVFNTYFAAKYYLPYFNAYTPESVIVIDAGKSQYISEMLMARGSRDYFKKANLVKSAEINRMKEIPVYNSADVVIVDNVSDRDELAQEIPGIAVEVVPEQKDGEDNAELVAGESEKVFSRVQKRSPREILPEIVIVGTGDPAAAPEEGEAALPFATVPSEKVSPVMVEETGGMTALQRYNKGLLKVGREYGLIFPAGTIVPEESLKRMLFCAQSHPSHGIVASASNRTLGSLVNMKNIGEFLAKHYLSNFGYWQETRRITETCLLVKRELIETVGTLDDRYLTMPFAHFDYCLKAFQSGYKAILNNESFVYYPDIPVYDGADMERDSRLLYDKWCDTGIEFLEKVRDETSL
ncbi:MAG: glycosyltransferase family 2 protein [Endomicrobiales bacterium]